MSLGLQGLVGVVVEHLGNVLVCTVDNHLQTFLLLMYISEVDRLCGTKKQGTSNSTLMHSRVNRAWARGLSFNDNLLLSIHQERLNPLVNITIDTIYLFIYIYILYYILYYIYIIFIYIYLYIY